MSCQFPLLLSLRVCSHFKSAAKSAINLQLKCVFCRILIATDFAANFFSDLKCERTLMLLAQDACGIEAH